MTVINNLEWPQLHISLNNWIIEPPTNQTFGIINSVCRIGCCLILGSIANKSLTFACECNVRWCNPIPLIVCNDFDSSVAIHAQAARRCTQIYANRHHVVENNNIAVAIFIWEPF